jgi:hypothetical protein
MCGAFAGAPTGARNGAYRHGHYTFGARVERAQARLELFKFREVLETLVGARRRD